VYWARWSRGLEGDVEQIGSSLAVFKPLGDNPQGEGLYPCLGLGPACPVGKNTRQLRDFGDPPTVLFLLEFDSETQVLPPDRPILPPLR